MSETPSTAVMYLKGAGGVCFAHGPFEGIPCPKWPACITDPQKPEFIAMGNKHLATGETPSTAALCNCGPTCPRYGMDGQLRMAGAASTETPEQIAENAHSLIYALWQRFVREWITAAIREATASLRTERDEALARERQLREGLRKLKNEAKAFKSLVRVSDVGHTNMKCLNHRIDEAEALLSQPAAKPGSSHTEPAESSATTDADSHRP